MGTRAPKHSHLRQVLLGSTLSIGMLTGCSSDDDDSGEGYLMIYNASANAPELTIEIEKEDDTVSYGGIEAFSALGAMTLDSGNYPLQLELATSNEDTEVIYSSTDSVNSGDITFVAVTGDIKSPEILTFEYQYQDPDSEDEQFLVKFLNLRENSQALDVYMSLADESFDEATMVTTVSFAEMTEDFRYDVEDYKIYLTENGSTEVLFESGEIPLLYTNQQVFTILPSYHNDDQLMLNKISPTGSVTEYMEDSDVAKIKVYNAMDANDLLPEYTESMNFHLNDISETPLYSDIQRSQVSTTTTVDAGDYGMDITTVDNADKLTHSQILSLPDGSDRTIFFYLTEVEEADDGDDETEEETTLYVNSLAVENEPMVGAYHHNIKVLNFVEDYASVVVYFVGPDESISTTSNKLTNSRAITSSIDLINDRYDIFVIGKEDSSDVLLKTAQLDLTEDSGNLFLVIEQEDKDIPNFSISSFSQN